MRSVPFCTCGDAVCNATTLACTWLPIVGDPLCAVAGWLKLPFWPCMFYMIVGKLARYITMTVALLWLFPGALRFAA